MLVDPAAAANTPAPAPLVMAILLLAFLIMWPAGFFLSSVQSGWWFLAKAYPEDPSYVGASQPTSGIIGFISYNHILWVGADEKGLHLESIMILCPFHPPTCIPWSAIKVSLDDFFIFAYVTFKMPQATVRLTRKSLKALAQRGDFPEEYRKLILGS